MLARGQFQEWWNLKFFTTDWPFYRNYQKLAKLGADLDYVEHLRTVFLLGELSAKAQRDDYRKKKKKSPIPKWVADAVKTGYGKIVVGYTLKALHPSVNESLLYRVLQSAAEITTNAWDVFYPVLLDSISNEEQNKAVKEKMPEATRQVLRESALLPLIAIARPEPPKPGNPSDPWGTLFLLAITEHMAERTKNKHHYYRDAYGLLEKLRAEPTPTSRSKRAKRSPQDKGQTAMTRIAQYKQNHRGWRRNLQLLKRSYQNFISAQKP